MLRRGAIFVAAAGAAFVMGGHTVRAASPAPLPAWYTQCGDLVGIDLAECAFHTDDHPATGPTKLPALVPGEEADHGNHVESVGGATESVGGVNGAPVQSITFNDGGPHLITF